MVSTFTRKSHGRGLRPKPEDPKENQRLGAGAGRCLARHRALWRSVAFEGNHRACPGGTRGTWHGRCGAECVRNASGRSVWIETPNNFETNFFFLGIEDDRLDIK